MNNKGPRRMIYAYETSEARSKRLFLDIVEFNLNRTWHINIFLPYEIHFALCLATPEADVIGLFIVFAKLTENKVFQDCPAVCSLIQGGKIVQHPIPETNILKIYLWRFNYLCPFVRKKGQNQFEHVGIF